MSETAQRLSYWRIGPRIVCAGLVDGIAAGSVRLPAEMIKRSCSDTRSTQAAVG
jgi:hypothetical protein